jgi:hydroxyacylglutathione hydrolase
LQIAPNVQLIAVEASDYYNGFTRTPNVYLVNGSERAIFIDTGFGKDEEIAAFTEAWSRQGKPAVSNIFLTHRHHDHTSGASKLKNVVGGKITSSQVEKEFIDPHLTGHTVEQTIADGEVLDLGGVTLEFIHTPGHTMGSMCVYYREQGVLFTGDMILGSSTTVISPGEGDMKCYIESMRKLKPYTPRLIAPGHGPMVTETIAKIDEMISHRLSREEQIVGLLRNGKDTIDSLFEALYPSIDERLHGTAKRQITSHLIKLEKDDRADKRGERYVLKQ